MKKQLNIGQWIECENGLGQVLCIRELYRESFEEPMNEEKIGELRMTIAIVKIFCDFNGKIKSRGLIQSFLQKHCDEISSKNMKMVNTIIENNDSAYRKYTLYDDKLDLGNVISLKYFVDINKISEIKSDIQELRTKLLPIFTFKEFKKEFVKKDYGFKLENFITYKMQYNRSEIVEIILNNRLYKVKGKEKLFDWVKIILPH